MIGDNDKRPDGPLLASLWSNASVFASHIAGCTCAGFAVPLNASAVEEDLLDFLTYRYKNDGRDHLAGFVESRLAARTPGFGVWLERLDEAPLDPGDRQRLMDDIFTTLDSMNAARSARGGFVCY